MGMQVYEDDDGLKDDERKLAAKRRRDFECPDCAANNPVEEPLKDRDEVRCNYCGSEFRVTESDGGKIKLKSM